MQRNFHANAPNQKWLIDITEFIIPAGKVYFSPIVDCFDGMLPAWRISLSPYHHMLLVNSMLEDARHALPQNEYLLSTQIVAVITVGTVELKEWKEPIYNVPCQRKGALPTIRPVKVSFDDWKMKGSIPVVGRV